MESQAPDWGVFVAIGLGLLIGIGPVTVWSLVQLVKESREREKFLNDDNEKHYYFVDDEGRHWWR